MLLDELTRNGGTELRAQLTLRPRERKPTPVQLHVVPAHGRDGEWVWNVTPASVEAPDPGAPVEHVIGHARLGQLATTRTCAGNDGGVELNSPSE